MTILEFRELDQMDKVSAILQFGRLMAENADEEKRTFVYSLETFFVAACYLRGNDQLTEIICYRDVDPMVPHCRKHSAFTDPSQRYEIPEG